MFGPCAAEEEILVDLWNQVVVQRAVVSTSVSFELQVTFGNPTGGAT